MGFLDGLLGGKNKLKEAAPNERLFQIGAAQVTLETGFDIKHRGVAGIVFQALATAEFGQLIKDTEELLHASAADTGTEVSSAEDSHGYRWVILRDDDFDDLLVALNVVSGELAAGGYGDRLLCCVFPFVDPSGRPIHFIYNFKRGYFSPFAPKPGSEHVRDNERELQLKAQIGGELPIEPELTRWFPLWDIPL